MPYFDGDAAVVVPGMAVRSSRYTTRQDGCLSYGEVLADSAVDFPRHMDKHI
jgi:hypothetical protein